MKRSTASLSLDLDNLWSYLKVHGDSGWQEYPTYLSAVVPRFLQMADRLGFRMTVFVVGRDAQQSSNRAALRLIGDEGHEVGNHSLEHEPWMQFSSAEEVDAELAAAERAIGEATGLLTRGFRGPGFALSPAMLETLLRRGYRYDCSTFPTYLGPLARAYYFLHARLDGSQKDERKSLFGTWSDGRRPVTPYHWELAGGTLLEIPVTTFPGARVPIHMS